MSRFHTKRKAKRKNLPKHRGAKRCPYCKANSVRDGSCSSCDAKITDEIPTSAEIEEFSLRAAVIVPLVFAAKRSRKRKDEEEE